MRPGGRTYRNRLLSVIRVEIKKAPKFPSGPFLIINPPESLGRFYFGTLEQQIRPGQNLAAEDLHEVCAGCAHSLTAQKDSSGVLKPRCRGTVMPSR